jgi:hypothetical protein
MQNVEGRTVDRSRAGDGLLAQLTTFSALLLYCRAAAIGPLDDPTLQLPLITYQLSLTTRSPARTSQATFCRRSAAGPPPHPEAARSTGPLCTLHFSFCTLHFALDSGAVSTWLTFLALTPSFQSADLQTHTIRAIESSKLGRTWTNLGALEIARAPVTGRRNLLFGNTFSRSLSFRGARGAVDGQRTQRVAWAWSPPMARVRWYR